MPSKISSSKQFKLKKLFNPLYSTLAAATILAPAAVTVAQETLPEVTATGTRAALRQGLNLKQNATSAIESISAEDIGKFPDKNLAESLQRVPGVTINRGFAGEGNEVSIRGVNPQLTHTLLNGQFVASTEWFSLGSNNRSFNMDMLPSELVTSIEVHKSPTASQDEGGVGGTVVVNTRKPLDAKESQTMFFSAEMNTNSIADTDKVGAGATAYIGWKNDEDNFGASALIHTNEIVGRA
ncbi:MAG: TonB-dependent receptor plug domain-containing protein, partial [Arenicellales bacterium]